MYALRRASVALFLGLGLAGAGPSGADQEAPPSEPLALLGWPGPDGGTQLTWQPPLDDGGAAALEYRVYQGSSLEQRQLVATTAATRVHVDGMPTQNWAFYWVTAVNANGEGPPSAPALVHNGGCVFLDTWQTPPTVAVDPACFVRVKQSW